MLYKKYMHTWSTLKLLASLARIGNDSMELDHIKPKLIAHVSHVDSCVNQNYRTTVYEEGIFNFCFQLALSVAMATLVAMILCS